ncbi:MAG: hypothetical protein A2X69_18180 [Rhodobacteraceae bacterium GWF1_65_7]|nr:MAG: hypothetical protein A2X69_18180 [Rhodobacteraceae bacterium GWF1_65_7]
MAAQRQAARRLANLARQRQTAHHRAAPVGTFGQRQQDHAPDDRRPPDAGFAIQLQINDGPRVKGLRQQRPECRPRRRIEHGRQRHPPRLHPKKIGEILPGDPDPPGLRRDLFNQKRPRQGTPDATRVDLGAAGQGRSIAQGFPIAAHFGNHDLQIHPALRLCCTAVAAKPAMPHRILLASPRQRPIAIWPPIGQSRPAGRSCGGCQN